MRFSWGNTSDKATDNKNGNAEEIQQVAEKLRLQDDDLRAEATLYDGTSNSTSNHDATNVSSATTTTEASSCPFRFVPLKMGGNNGRTHKVSSGSRRFIDEEEVTYDDLYKLTDTFYQKAFQDATLDTFLRSHDDPHAERFAKWIHQKLSGSTLWDQDRETRNLEPVRLANGYSHVVHDRSSAHAAAWYSPKRAEHLVGRHFKLDECRVWMRLHFWSLRETGLLERTPSFADYYVRFIGHFVRVYESTAPAFARDSLRWSADPDNIATYVANGRRMNDVLGLSLSQALAQIPASEANDHEWPYNKTPPATTVEHGQQPQDA